MKNFRSIIFTVFPLLIFALSSCNTTKIETQDNYEVVDLPDGSKVYLNQYSEITYSKKFGRSVTAKGEFYFEVTKQEVPFIVRLDLGELKVLGTAFNIESNSGQIALEVAEGSVELSTITGKVIVNQREQATYKEGEEIQKGIKIFNFKKWVYLLEKEMNDLGREIELNSKDFEKELEKSSKDLEKGLEKMGKDIEKSLKKLGID